MQHCCSWLRLCIYLDVRAGGLRATTSRSPHHQAQWRYADWVECCIRRNSAQFQLHPLVVPQDSQTKQEPAGRMRTPQVEQKGASTAAIPGVNASSLRGEAGATVG